MDRKRTSDSVVKLLNKLYYGKRRSLGEVLAEREDEKVKLPLKAVDIESSVNGRLGDVTIKQSFKNCYSESLEAVYIFPVSSSASIHSVEMRIGDRTVKGKINERGEARRQYQEAVSSGKRACLLEQERDEVFTVSLGNIQPEEIIEVEIKYCESLTLFEDGTTELRLPLVVAPRYLGGEPVAREQVGSGVALDSDRVPDASRLSPPRLVDDFNPEVDLNIHVTLECDGKRSGDDLRLKDLACSQHATRIGFDDGSIEVQLANKRELMNRDFVLRWTVVGKSLDCQFSSCKDTTRAGHIGLLSLLPPKEEKEENLARDVVFLIDRSGSMHGEKMVSAKRACKYLLSSLGPADRFAINAFDDQNDWFECKYLKEDKSENLFYQADEEALGAALDFVTQVEPIGGTEIGFALSQALDNLSRQSDRAPVIVLLTDGQVADESGILSLVQSSKVGARIFCVGVDTSLNYGFLKHIADRSGGLAFLVNPGGELEDSMRKIASQIGEPLINNLSVEGINCKIDQSSVAPQMVPDLFSGRAVDLFFRFEGSGKERPRVLVKGTYLDGSLFQKEIRVGVRGVKSLGRLWARQSLRDLEDRYRASSYGFGESADLEKVRLEIINLSLGYSILCRFTAFTVVDDQVIEDQASGFRHSVQPVHNPHAWSTGSAANSPASSGGVWGASSSSSFSGPGTMSGFSAESGGGLYGSSGFGFGQSIPKPPSSSQPLPQLHSWGAPEEPSQPLKQIVVNLDKFVLAWREFWLLVDEGKIPEVDALVLACEELRDSLDDHPVAFEMPKISTVIALNYSGLIAAMLAPNLTLSGLRAMRKQLNLGFDDALAEAEATLTRALGKTGAFWRFTV